MTRIAVFGAGRIGTVHAANVAGVVIASATDTHAALLERAAEAGKASSRQDCSDLRVGLPPEGRHRAE